MKAIPKELLLYETQTGKQPFTEWLFGLKDKKTIRIITQRLKRVSLGNLGDCSSIGDDIYELRFNLGPGYRAYFAEEGHTIVLLLCGGDKSTQTKDIEKAKTYWQDYRSHC